MASSATNCLLTGREPLNSVDTLNEAQGISKLLLDKIVDSQFRERARNTAFADNREQIRQNKVARFEAATQITAGICFNGNGCHLNDQVLEWVRGINQKKRIRNRQQQKKEKGQNENSRKKWSKYDQSRDKGSGQQMIGKPWWHG